MREIWDALRDMPSAMRAMAVMSLFQWYAMSGYWGYVTNSISRSVYGTADASTAAYREAVLTNGQVGAFFNLIAFVSALAMAPIARKVGAGRLHALLGGDDLERSLPPPNSGRIWTSSLRPGRRAHHRA